MLLGGCADFDREFQSAYNQEQISLEYELSRAQVTNVYTTLEDGHYTVGDAMLASLTDEAEYTPQGTAQLFNSGAWNDQNNPDDKFAHYYEGIRKANLFLESEKIVDLSPWKNDPAQSSQLEYQTKKSEVENWPKEVRFLRAYYYFELIKRYGGVPLLTHSVDLEGDMVSIKRNTLDECIQFIVDECDAITNDDGLKITYNSIDLGRATRGAALALKSRVLLYAASDLWNMPEKWAPGYANKEYISVTGDRTEKWKAAAKAAKAVIDLQTEDGKTAYKMSADYTMLGKTYSGDEIIFVRRVNNDNNFERYNFPAGYPNSSGRITPSQNLVDAYEMTNGTKFDWNNEVHKANPYENRDPRLAMTVYTNGAKFKNITLETYPNGANGVGPSVPNATTTGYYLRKFVDSNIDLVQNNQTNHPWIIFRISEMYLNYAEALNEYDPGNADVSKYASMARGRTGVNMPAIVETDQDVMRERIRNERRVELAFEGHRHWDARRWMTALDEFGSPLYGVNITPVDGGFIYDRKRVEGRVFLPKMYMYPLPKSVMLNENVIAAGWPQNPEW